MSRTLATFAAQAAADRQTEHNPAGREKVAAHLIRIEGTNMNRMTRLQVEPVRQ